LDPTGQRYVYFRSAAAPGVILELLENVPAFADFASRLEARAKAYTQPSSIAVQRDTPSAPAAGVMRAALLHGYGSPDLFRIETIPEPVPGPGQIRVRVWGAAVNPVDIKARQGRLPWLPLTFPARLGGDVAGVVD